MSSKTKTTAKKEEAASALVPTLRFPEFRKADRWEEKRLGEVASFFKGKGISKAEIATNGRRPCIRYGELYTRYGEVIDKVFSRTDADDAELFFSRSNDVIIPGSGETKLDIAKASCVMHDDVALGGDLNVIRTKHNGVFLSYYFNGPKKRDIAMVAQGDTVVHLYPSQLEKLAIALPKEAEQQKIAECLSSVDGLIAAQARKLDALKTHKKGLMQQLFPREGETQPRLRFPEFNNAGEWVERKLGTVCDIQRGKFSHRPRNDPRFFGGQYPFIQTGDVVKSGGGAVIASQSLNEEGLAVSKLFKPTIVLVTIAANIGDTGLLQTEGCFTDSVVGLIPKEDVISVFLELIMRGQKEYLNKVASTGAQKNINNEILREVNVLLPSVPEQQRIATCLTSLDDLIAAQTQKLAALKTHKQGLMQQLFPSPEETADL